MKFSYEAIKQPHISEKGSYLAEKDQYIFEVSPNYNKQEIKNAVEGIYGVNVLSVNSVKIPAKRRRLGKTEGFRRAYKKAIVKIKNGQKIEIL
ncbi:MAG: 50S ribosomal protein L23 [Candidatus Staskawiczbacteria bacterium RIFOXYD2_FULL_37_9]|uniref:Large ribosomal subunit protein uL23 n=1 Tax=Candidatus Staskawiczbacteria bacterium RIFOXYB1_FULL_37_44 TaxID=1802223 RepID=A0A1G2IVR5_9BACT|nr:MAG: 50S ribosomal protein L23 [Candidatus Staskawiczbacteria bacterium RIFOXYB1_FULL_37_44]OGZ84079.1 MAG: 50S ribosomal protein L23 [Candidatus Staskawiczbacteria bacterium RIFOXYC1_FULL_37_52]OGZ88916.1 MAG: 50S ribosomal protein L23 [Candidatus Staskawiczbacteria bacterium RIFOXYC2_FULL_37_19]OGZ89867.1 MAG: 50S ribosomal protein L23 [Candidatus Staskawiczbacteria bacterium RIFOXYD1_FULL_37_110]OGZ92960.1 MAG: 50S ribosomal protein L23 [Candidatus Staskawiczbacteria bacterium RIFOXYD2_FU